MSTAGEGAAATGHCACGAVSYAVSGPLRPVIACHCESCRRQSGNYVTASACAAADLKITGEENLAGWRASDEATRQFCRVCGSQLFWVPDHGRHVSITAGTLDGPTGLHVERHIFTAEKGDYYELTDGLPQCRGT